MDPLKCKGGTCDDERRCVMANGCQYKSSAELSRTESGEMRNVKDYAGTVDGQGVKQVMVSPKCGVQMIAPQFIEGIGAVLTYGAQKYAANNWMRGMSWTTVFGGVLRHLWAWFRGEELDESGLPHLHHAACGLMFLCYYTSQPVHHQFDDRVFK